MFNTIFMDTPLDVYDCGGSTPTKKHLFSGFSANFCLKVISIHHHHLSFFRLNDGFLARNCLPCPQRNTRTLTFPLKATTSLKNGRNIIGSFRHVESISIITYIAAKSGKPFWQKWLSLQISHNIPGFSSCGFKILQKNNFTVSDCDVVFHFGKIVFVCWDFIPTMQFNNFMEKSKRIRKN